MSLPGTLFLRVSQPSVCVPNSVSSHPLKRGLSLCRRTTNQRRTLTQDPGHPASPLWPQKDRWAMHTGTREAPLVGMRVSAPPFLHRPPLQI